MQKYIISGGRKLSGVTRVSGAKNVAIKAIVAACLTQDEVIIENIPLISDFKVMVKIVREIGGSVKVDGHTAVIKVEKIKKNKLPIEIAGEVRTSSMFIAPLLARVKNAVVPNPGGCRLGARPIDRTIMGLKALGVEVNYQSTDGYFYAKTSGLKATNYEFSKNTHTGTETMLLAAVLAKGITTLSNAAEEPEIDDLIKMLNLMGADIERLPERKIKIVGVEKLHGCRFKITPDRNEIVTIAIAALITKGDITVLETKDINIDIFLNYLREIGAGVDVGQDSIRFYYKKELKSISIKTEIYPGFMTDWQAPWTVLMLTARGTSHIHETVFEYRFGYVEQLKKMGANIRLYNPVVKDRAKTYNFNLEDDRKEYFHAISIDGPAKIHNAFVNIVDLRAGAALVLAGLIAKGLTTVHGIEHLDRGYEDFEKRLNDLGADIKRLNI